MNKVEILDVVIRGFEPGDINKAVPELRSGSGDVVLKDELCYQIVCLFHLFLVLSFLSVLCSLVDVISNSLLKVFKSITQFQ